MEGGGRESGLRWEFRLYHSRLSVLDQQLGTKERSLGLTQMYAAFCLQQLGEGKRVVNALPDLVFLHSTNDSTA